MKKIVVLSKKGFGDSLQCRSALEEFKKCYTCCILRKGHSGLHTDHRGKTWEM